MTLLSGVYALSPAWAETKDVLVLISTGIGIITSLVMLVRWLVISPLDRKLETHTEKVVNDVEIRFLKNFVRRLEALEDNWFERGSRDLLWRRALHQDLKEQGIRSPRPDDYHWSAPLDAVAIDDRPKTEERC